jgi:hypothetical protein
LELEPKPSALLCDGSADVFAKTSNDILCTPVPLRAPPMEFRTWAKPSTVPEKSVPSSTRLPPKLALSLTFTTSPVQPFVPATTPPSAWVWKSLVKRRAAEAGSALAAAAMEAATAIDKCLLMVI